MAIVPPPSPSPSSSPSSAPQAPRPVSSNASLALVMGIFGFVCCPVVPSALALYFAAEAERELALNPWMDGASNARTGKILGIVGLVLSVCVIVFYVAIIAIGLATEGFEA